MFDNIFAAIEKWMRELLTGMVESNMSTMFTDVNEKTSEIAAQVGRTPQNWNSSVFSMIQNLSESVVVPIAGIIITLVLCYELISMLTERNNLHDVDTWMFFKYFVKAWVAIYLVSNTFTITMAVFDVGQSVVNSASGIINGETAIDVSSLSMQMQAAMATMEIGELVVLALETFLVSFCMVWNWTAYQDALHSSFTRRTKLPCRALKRCSSRTASLTVWWAMCRSAITKCLISGMIATTSSSTITLLRKVLTLFVRAAWWR